MVVGGAGGRRKALYREAWGGVAECSAGLPARRCVRCARASLLGVQAGGRGRVGVGGMRCAIIKLADLVMLHGVAHRLKAQVEGAGGQRGDEVLLRGDREARRRK